MSLVLFIAGGFLLGGAISFWRLPDRGTAGIVVVAVLVLAAALALAGGVMRVVA